MSLFSALACASRALCASAFACSASLVARPASSFVRCSSSFARLSSASALASLPRTFASDALAFWASAFTRSSSFSVESAPTFGGSLVEDGRGDVLAGAGCTVGVAGAGCTVAVEGEDGARAVLVLEEAASSDLKARTSRAISRQVMSSV
jgi:phosphotransferase system HPr-like phosphotransfer protein